MQAAFNVNGEMGGIDPKLSESIEYIVVSRLSADCIISTYPIVSECSTSSCRKCVISFRGRESRGPFPLDNTGCKRAAVKLRNITLRHSP